MEMVIFSTSPYAFFLMALFSDFVLCHLFHYWIQYVMNIEEGQWTLRGGELPLEMQVSDGKDRQPE